MAPRRMEFAARVVLAAVWISGLVLACTPAPTPTGPTPSQTSPPSLLSPSPQLDNAAGSSPTSRTTATQPTAPTQTPRPANPTRTAEPTSTPDPTACLPPGLDRPADGDYAPVAWISDGASFVIDRQGLRQTVRLIGIHASPNARRTLETLLANQVVRLVSDPAGPDADPTGRLLRYVLTLDGIFINDLLLSSGVARYDPGDERQTSFACSGQFAAAEAAAREARAGVWGVVAALQAPTATLTTTSRPAIPTLTASPSSSLPVSPSTPGTQTITPGPSPTAGPSSTTSGSAATPTATASGSGSSDNAVEIINIYVIGTPPNEPDEYIELKNTGTQAFDLTGWSLYSDETYAEVYFPAFSLGPGESCRVYTNLVRPDSCAGISFESDVEAWPNDTGCGGLYDPDEFPVADFCYPPLE